MEELLGPDPPGRGELPEVDVVLQDGRSEGAAPVLLVDAGRKVAQLALGHGQIQSGLKKCEVLFTPFWMFLVSGTACATIKDPKKYT